MDGGGSKLDLGGGKMFGSIDTVLPQQSKAGDTQNVLIVGHG